MKSDKRHQGSRDVAEDHLADQRGNGSKGGMRTSSRDERKLRGADPVEVNDARQSDGELSSEGSDESRSSQEEVSWIQVHSCRPNSGSSQTHYSMDLILVDMMLAMCLAFFPHLRRKMAVVL
jgi:hypothetical protein